MLGSDLCHCSDAYIVLKGTITAERDNDDKTRNKNWSSKLMPHLDHASQKSVTHS